jgi:hypothetical protein
MKFKFSIVFFLVISIVIQSCGDDDVIPRSELSGEWKAQTLEGTIRTESTFSGSSIISNSTVTGANMNYYLTLTMSDNKFTAQGSYDIELATTAQGSTLSMTDSYSNLSESGTYTSTDSEINLDASIYDISINGMVLEVTGGHTPATYSITNNVLTVTEVRQEEMNNGTISSVTDINIVSIWNRQ